MRILNKTNIWYYIWWSRMRILYKTIILYYIWCSRVRILDKTGIWYYIWCSRLRILYKTPILYMIQKSEDIVQDLCIIYDVGWVLSKAYSALYIYTYDYDAVQWALYNAMLLHFIWCRGFNMYIDSRGTKVVAEPMLWLDKINSQFDNGQFGSD